MFLWPNPVYFISMDMKKKEERQYFDKEWKDMKASLKSYLRDEGPEDLHQFRVQVKKLYAFLTLAGSVEHHQRLTKHFKPVKGVFKRAGDIRNVYINLELGKANQINNSAFANSQHQLLENATEKFKLNKVKHLKKIKGAYKVLKNEIKPISDIYINLFYQNRLQQISNYLAALKFNDQLHKSRKLVKILMYNNKLVHAKLDISFNRDYLDRVQTAIGEWHDNMLATRLLLNYEAKDKLEVISLKKAHTKLKNQITALVKDFYNQATTVVEVPVEQVS